MPLFSHAISRGRQTDRETNRETDRRERERERERVPASQVRFVFVVVICACLCLLILVGNFVEQLYVWRAMRLLAKHKLPYLNMMQTESIETVVSHLMKDETKQQLQVKDVQDTVTEPKQPQKAHLEAEVENGK